MISPVNESHVEMDLAWAMYEAWPKIQTGEVDTALVYAFGKSSAGVLRRSLSLQLEPYTMTPLWPDTVSLAALQARVGIDAEVWDEAAMAEVANRSLTDAEKNDWSIRKGGSSVEELLARPMFADPLRKHDCSPVTDGAAAIVLASGDRAREVREKPAWIGRISHFVDPMSMGTRDLTRAPSAARAAANVDLSGVEVAELHAPFSHQELILRRELGLADDIRINPSGGALTSNPIFSGGGIRIGEAATRVWSGEITKAVGHATSGPALQQNLLCTLVSTPEGASN
ncbi:thiolase domain-containing protein [Nocardioides pyridinolyticus]